MRTLSNFFIRSLQLINSLSIDVSIGAAAGALFLLYICKGTASPWVIIALISSVWMVYTLDHLWDARAIKINALTYRHRIHQRYFRILSWALLIMVLIGLIIILPNLPKKYLLPGFSIAGLVLVHWVVSHIENSKNIFLFKEFRISFIYVAGISVPSIATNTSFGNEFYMSLGMFWILATINLLTFSMLERDSDLRQKLISITSKQKDNIILKIILWFVFAFTLLWLLSFFIWPDMFLAWLVFLLVFLGTISPLIYNFFTPKNESFRTWADWSFCLPFLILL